jgi:hypothetical protein
MQRAGLEWLHRLAHDPRRLFWRYAVTNPLALAMLIFSTAAFTPTPSAKAVGQHGKIARISARVRLRRA